MLSSSLRLLAAVLIIDLASAQKAFSVHVHENIRGAELEDLWNDYGLGLSEPRNIYRSHNNYLLIMNSRTAGRIKSDWRILQINEIGKEGSEDKANSAPIIVDHVLKSQCSRLRRRNTTLRSMKETRLLEEAILLTVGTGRLYDPQSSGTQNVRKRLEEFYAKYSKVRISVDAESDRLLRLRVLPSLICAVFRHLLLDEDVVLIEKSNKMAFLSNYASATGQSGSRSLISDSNALIWKQGIMGQGQVIGIGDSGIDVDSCFFRESKSSAPEISGCNMTRHKIACYFTSSQASPGDPSTAFGGGHGTLVAGVLAGLHTSILKTESDWNISYSDIMADTSIPNGMAPLAKISMNDIGSSDGALFSPADLVKATYFSDPYNLGQVRIHSNSWGCDKHDGGRTRDCNAYDSQARSVDEFVWSNMDFLVLFAAGNSGGDASIDMVDYKDGYYTVGTPATAKNGLTIGATYQNGPFNHDCGGLQRYCTAEDLMDDSSRGPTFDGRIKPDLVFPGESILGPFSSGNSQDFSEGQTCTLSSLDSGTARMSGTVSSQVDNLHPYSSEIGIVKRCISDIL
jgi:subtilisin family serine protease